MNNHSTYKFLTLQAVEGVALIFWAFVLVHDTLLRTSQLTKAKQENSLFSR